MENFLRPWIIALLFASLGASIAWLRGALTSIPILRGFKPYERSEAQIALEKRAELASRFISLGALASIVALFILVVGADHAANDIEGAMCAHGVIHSNEYGPLALGAAAAVAFLGLVFWELHRLDLRVPVPVLVRPQFIAFLFVAPVAIYSSHLTLRFIESLDFSIVATCCSSGMSTNLSHGEALPSTTPHLSFFLSLLALAAVIALAFCVYRAASSPYGEASSPYGEASSPYHTAPSPHLIGWLLALASVIALLSSATALSSSVAPHLYETPAHRCAFCLLRLPELGFGLPYLIAFFIVLIGAIRATLGVSLLGHKEIGESARGFLKNGALLLIVGAAALMLISSFPVIRYLLISGETLFGW